MSKHNHCCDSNDYQVVHEGKWKRVICEDDDSHHYEHHHDHHHGHHHKEQECKKVLICKEEEKDECKKEKKCKKLVLKVNKVIFYDDCNLGNSCVPEVDVSMTLDNAVNPPVPTPITAFPFAYTFALPVDTDNVANCRSAITNIDFLIDIFGVTYNPQIPGGAATVTLEILSGATSIFKDQRTLTSGLPTPPITDFNLSFARKVDLLKPLVIRGLVSAPSGGSVDVNGQASVYMTVNGRNKRCARKCNNNNRFY